MSALNEIMQMALHFLSSGDKSQQPGMTIRFWGVRGTLPVPGKKTLRYGGNTNCVSLQIAEKHFFIFDAGTGIKELSNYLIHQNKFPFNAKIFISHPHYDHIDALPFFLPLFMKENSIEILGAKQGDKDIAAVIAGMMNGLYLPFTVEEFTATLTYRTLGEESFYIDDISIKTILLNHPGKCLGYRVQYQKKSFCYITDSELFYESSPHYKLEEAERLIRFIKETDVLVIDTTYSDEAYPSKEGWGHSCVSRVVDAAHRAQVKLLCLFHHDPDQGDSDIDDKLRQAQRFLKSKNATTRCIAPCEGEQLVL